MNTTPQACLGCWLAALLVVIAGGPVDADDLSRPPVSAEFTDSVPSENRAAVAAPRFPAPSRRFPSAAGSGRGRSVREGALHQLFGVAGPADEGSAGFSTSNAAGSTKAAEKTAEFNTGDAHRFVQYHTAAMRGTQAAAGYEAFENEDDLCDESIKPIAAIGVNIAPSFGELPPDYAAACFARHGSVWDDAGASRDPIESYFFWQAPGLCHQPLYFEDVNLERYGYSARFGQPLLSGVHFVAHAALLPYLSVAQPPKECVSTLGHYRPGDCVPYQVHHLPLDLKAAAFQGAVVTGLIFLIP